MSPHTDWLPLFPLNTVLFPQGVLPLKVFEARYIDMVKECLRQDAPFGVVKILSGQEVGHAAQPETLGCLAHITQWDMQDLGVLLLRTAGGQRFRILETRVLADQRLEARVQLIADEAAREAFDISDIHVACATALKTVITQINARGLSEEGEEFISPFAEPLQFDNPSWVGYRWCEILPISLKAKQKLLELDDAQTRLSIIYQYLLQHQIIESPAS